MNNIEYGICDICGREANLQRKYYHFNIKCECHLPTHSEMIKYCSDCVPLRPAETTIEIFDPIDEKIKNPDGLDCAALRHWRLQLGSGQPSIGQTI